MRELKNQFHVTVIDVKSFFEHTLVLIIGGQFPGHTRELKKRFHVTAIDAKELVLRAHTCAHY